MGGEADKLFAAAKKGTGGGRVCKFSPGGGLFLRKVGENKQGAAIIVVLISLSVLMLLGSAFLEQGLGEQVMARNYASNIQAYYLAEAGIEVAYAALKQDFYFCAGGGELTGGLVGGTYQVTLGRVRGDERLLTSRGEAGMAWEIIKVELVNLVDWDEYYWEDGEENGEGGPVSPEEMEITGEVIIQRWIKPAVY